MLYSTVSTDSVRSSDLPPSLPLPKQKPGCDVCKTLQKPVN
jgi:hypothetical protein